MHTDESTLIGSKEYNYNVLINEALDEARKYKAAFELAMITLERISENKRNTKDKLQASATVSFLRTQLGEQND